MVKAFTYSHEDQKRMWERRPTWELQNMIQALSMLTWLNTPEDKERLAIAKEIVKERSNVVRCKGCDGKVEEELLSRIELCPGCTEAWVKEATS